MNGVIKKGANVPSRSHPFYDVVLDVEKKCAFIYFRTCLQQNKLETQGDTKELMMYHAREGKCFNSSLIYIFIP